MRRFRPAPWLVAAVLSLLLSAGPRPVRADELPSALGMLEFVKVNKGTGKFPMGGGNGKEGTKTGVIATDFEIGKYEVTQALWKRVMGKDNNPSKFKEGKDADQQPVEKVSYDDVQKFLTELNKLEKDGGYVYRLPTEAEWEFACRGGATSKEDCSFNYYFDKPTNTLTEKLANFGHNVGKPTKVGSYPPNRLGLHDMHGNVFELTSDLYNSGPLRVVRGSSFNMDAGLCTAAFRFGNSPDTPNYDIGFRLVRVPSK